MNEEFSIFDMQAPEQPSIFPSKSKNDQVVEDLRAVFAAYRTQTTATTLDTWKEKYKSATSLSEKAAILTARDDALEYERESQSKAIQQEEEAKFSEYAAMPRHKRNKAFWEGLKADNPVLFWSKLGTELRIADKAGLGLAYHLKNGG